MSTDNPFPTPRYRIEIEGHAQTWRDLKGIVRQIETEMHLRRSEGPFEIVSGGGWSVKVTEPDPTQTPERYTDEVIAWGERNREEQRARKEDDRA